MSLGLDEDFVLQIEMKNGTFSSLRRIIEPKPLDSFSQSIKNPFLKRSVGNASHRLVGSGGATEGHRVGERLNVLCFV